MRIGSFRPFTKDIATYEPFMLPMYSSLLEPAFDQIRIAFVGYSRMKIPEDKLIKMLGSATIHGIAIATLRSITRVALSNINEEYKKSDKTEPIDIFYLKHYITPKLYSKVFRGFYAEWIPEVPFQVTRGMLNAVGKVLIGKSVDRSFEKTLLLSLARPFVSNLIPSLTVYPVMQCIATKQTGSEIVKRSFKRATNGSVAAALRSVGMSFVRSLLPGYKKTISVVLEVIGN